MGLLTNPSYLEKFPTFVLRYHNGLSVVCYVIGILWFILLAHPEFNAGTYFSENALLPGLVEGHYRDDGDTKQYLSLLKTESERYPNEIPVPWLTAQFIQLGITETYTHRFTLTNPLTDEVYHGENVYAILRAPRTANVESVVISAPYRSSASVHPSTLPSIALMLSLARFFRQQTYLAKDVIFLVTEHDQLGVQAWLDAYHQSATSDRALHTGTLVQRAGSIQAAINLEIHSDVVGHVDIKFEGLNGQLPNLDLFNLAVRLCGKEQIQVTFKNRGSLTFTGSDTEWLYSLHTMLSMMAIQATGVPTGNHGLFLRYNIEAITLQGNAILRPNAERSSKWRKPASLLQLGRVLEGMFRSLNNLQERLHQSFFLYLLPSVDRYISIGLYMPAFGLIAAPLVLKALGLRIMTNRDAAEGKAQKEQKNVKGVKSKLDFSKANPGDKFSVLATFPYLLVAHGVGLLTAISPPFFCQVGHTLNLTTEESISYGLIIIYLGIMTVLTSFLIFKQPSTPSWKVLKCIALIELATFLASVSLINISLATFLTVIYTPIAASVKPSVFRIWKCIKSLVLFAINPLSLTFIAVLSTLYSHEDVSLQLLQNAMIAFQRAVVYAVMDSIIYGNWLFNAMCAFLMPIWILLWCVQHSSVE